MVTVEQATAAGTKVEWTCTATDICDAAPVVVCDPPSGTVFPLGTTNQSQKDKNAVAAQATAAVAAGVPLAYDSTAGPMMGPKQ
jgi:hypothetical protein